MSQSKDVTVRLQALDGTWETCGVDRLRGVTPEMAPAIANGWGPDTAGFDLRRDPKAIWPDLGAWTPCEIEIGGVVVWDGRVKETPSRDGPDRVMSVQCEGWQYHLDDDLYERTYVHNKLGDWRDARGTLSEDLTAFTTAGGVQTDGAIVLGWPNGAILKAGDRVGVVLDMGPSTTAALAQVEFRGISVGNLGSGATIFVVTHPTPESAGQDTADAGTLALSTLGTSTNAISRTFATAYRYVSVFLYSQSAITLTGDVTIRIEAARIFPDASYAGAGNLSILKAPVVVNDALDRATVLLSSDRTQIDPNGTVAFSIPALAPGEPRTPREMWDAVNAYHDYQSKIAVGRVPVFKPKPAAALFEVGAWSSMEFEDTSANSGADIYSRVLVTGQSPDGTAVQKARSMFDLPGAVLAEPDGGETVPNPTFDTNTTGWSVGPAYNSVGTATFARDTTTFDTTPASGRMTYTLTPANAEAIVASHTLSGTFKQGLIYSISIRLKSGSTLFPVGLLRIAFGDVDLTNAPGAETNYVFGGGQIIAGAFTTYSLVWTPERDVTNPNLQVNWIGGHTLNDNLWIDSIRLTRSYTTLVERRGFRRSKILQVRSPLPTDQVAAAQIGDTWLAGHKQTPFKGTVKITGDQAVRNILTGRYVPLERLLLATGELLRFSDRVDPDTGAWGRDGRMAAVSYDAANNQATVTLDSTRAGFEALLERLAVVTGGS